MNFLEKVVKKHKNLRFLHTFRAHFCARKFVGLTGVLFFSAQKHKNFFYLMGEK